jgi:hypothetical protein
VEVVVIEAPSSVLLHAVHDQTIVEPVRYVSERVGAVIVIEGDGGETLAIGNHAFGYLEARNDPVGVQINCPDRGALNVDLITFDCDVVAVRFVIVAEASENPDSIEKKHKKIAD